MDKPSRVGYGLHRRNTQPAKSARYWSASTCFTRWTFISTWQTSPISSCAATRADLSPGRPQPEPRSKSQRAPWRVACFLRYCLFTTTDQLILMVQRRIADLWRQAAADVPATVNWAAMYKTLLGELVALSAQGAVPDAELRARLEALITETQKRKPPSRASLVREGLIDGIRPVRSLLVAIAKLPWQATGEHPAIEYLAKLQALYLKGSRKLPVEVVAPSLGMIWQVSISSPDRERAFQALEVATLFALRRAVRNGSVWIEHSLSFRGRARLFFTDERWQAESKKHYARLSLPSKAATFLKPLLARVTARCRCGGRCSPQWRTARG
jgi:hypothetical protein